MNFSSIEDSILEEKKKFNNFLSRFLKNSRVLIILLTASVITAVSISIWIKSPDYQILYDHLSNEDSGAIINQLNQMKIPYKITDVASQISVPKNNIYDIRLRLAEKNLPKSGGIGFELLDKEKFGISQFHEQINYQRALEGELVRTIEKINLIKSARIHLVFPKTSFFLEDKKKSSASIILELQPGQVLHEEHINAILHLISSSVPDLSSENISIVNQFGQLLNQPSSLQFQKSHSLQVKYLESIESRYSNRIKNILEPLFGIGNVVAEVTAQVDFNDQEETEEKYSPNNNYKNQSIRSYQQSIHDQIEKKDIPASLSNSTSTIRNNFSNKYSDKYLNNFENPSLSNVNRDNTINYELNHSILHTKMNSGKIKRLSVAIIVNSMLDKNKKLVGLTEDKIKNITDLTREVIGYSKSRGDSIHIVNTLFFENNKKSPIILNNSNTFDFWNLTYTCTPWLLSLFFLLVLLKKYICPFSKNNIKNKTIQNEKKYTQKYEDIEKSIAQQKIQNNLNTDKLINQICNISNQNPRTIALIIRQWMSDKK